MAKTPETYFIAIAGNIASGKTTLAKNISKKLKIRMYEEPVRDNPFLSKFYEDINLLEQNPNNNKVKKQAQKSSFKLQEFYLLNRILDHKKIMSYNEPIIQDRSIYEDKEIFTKNAFKTNLIKLKDYIKYNIIYFLLTYNLRKPDLLIYLATSTETLKKRLKKRNNDYEMELVKKENNYLFELNKRYKQFIKNYKGTKLIIFTDEMDYSKEGKDLNKIIKKIKRIMELQNEKKL